MVYVIIALGAIFNATDDYLKIKILDNDKNQYYFDLGLDPNRFMF